MADPNSSELVNSGGVSGACMMSSTWRDEHHRSLTSSQPSSDFIFNCGDPSVAFIFLTNWDSTNVSPIFGRSGMGIGKPTFVPVRYMEMGFKKIVRIALSSGVCKQHHAAAKLKSELNQAIGSIEVIAKASKEYILENTDPSAEKAQVIFGFFRNPEFYLSAKIN